MIQRLSLGLAIVVVALGLFALFYFNIITFNDTLDSPSSWWIALNVFLGVLLGLFILYTVFGLLTPLFIHSLVNKPEGHDPRVRSGFHLFTFIGPGEVKLIENGDDLVRMVMNTGGKRFARDGNRDEEAYWEIVDGETENPLADISWFFKPWAWYVYRTTKTVFTGIYPFQKVLEYPMERTKIKKVENRSAAPGTRESRSNNSLTVIEDFSDHFRLRQFQHTVHIKEAETKDKVPLDFLGIAEAEVRNPFKTAYGTDRWEQGLINVLTDKLNLNTKTLTVDQILTAETREQALSIAAGVKDIDEDTKTLGLEIKAFRVLELDPILPEDELKILRAEALAIQAGKATRHEGMALADHLRSVNAANNEGGLHALETLRYNAQVRTAEAAQGGTVFIQTGGSGSTPDPVQAAILAELQKLNAKGTP